MRKQHLEPINLDEVLGEETAQAARKLLDQGAKEEMLYKGAKPWEVQRNVNYIFFRPEWRVGGEGEVEDNGDTRHLALIHLFYAPRGLGPFVQDRYDDPTAVRENERGHVVPLVEHGEGWVLTEDFAKILRLVTKEIYNGMHVRIRRVVEIGAIEVVIPNAGTVVHRRQRYVEEYYALLRDYCKANGNLMLLEKTVQTKAWE